MDLEHVWMDFKNEHPIRSNTRTSYPRMYYNEPSRNPLNTDYSPSNLHNYLPKCSSVAYMNYPAEIRTPDACNGNTNCHPYYTHPKHFRHMHATGNGYCRLFTDGKIRDTKTNKDNYHEQQLNTRSFPSMYSLDERFNNVKRNIKKKRQPCQTKTKYMNKKNDFSNAYKLPGINVKNHDILQLKELGNPDNSNTITNQSLIENKDNNNHMHRLNLHKKNQMEEQHGLKKSDSQIMLTESNNSVTEPLSYQCVNTNGTSINSYQDINLNQENPNNVTSQYNVINNNDCRNDKVDINTSDSVMLNQEINVRNNGTSINDKNVTNTPLKEDTLVIGNNSSDILQNNDLECQESVPTESFILQPFFEGIDENGKDIIVMLVVPSENQALQETFTSVPAEMQIPKLEDGPETPQNFTEQKVLENFNCQGDSKDEALQLLPKEHDRNESKIHFFSNIDDFVREEIVQNSNDVNDENLIQNVNEKDYFSKSVKNKKNPATSKKKVTRNKKSTTRGFKNKFQLIIDQEMGKPQENIKHSSQKKLNKNKVCAISKKQTKPKWKQHFQWKTTKQLMIYQRAFLEKCVSYYSLKNRTIKNDMLSKMLKLILNKLGANMLKSMHDISRGIINIYSGKRSKFSKAPLNKNTLSKNNIFVRKK